MAHKDTHVLCCRSAMPCLAALACSVMLLHAALGPFQVSQACKRSSFIHVQKSPQNSTTTPCSRA